jgi:UDP-N-acetylglucosamine--N-acetylmuramyl-(pentapeptide) pyrophosphoryl-undecaprenol N-acetylglucosamine transferase
MKNKSIIIATGGTGGHIYPGITLADALRAKGYDVSFVGNKTKMEATLVPKAGFAFYSITNQGLTGTPLIKIVRVLSQIFPTITSIKHLRKIKPSSVVVFGGYVSIPVGLAAWICRIPLFLHEQNSIAGLANKVLAPFAKGIAVSYPSTQSAFKNKNIQFIGNPRGSLFIKHDDKASYFELLNLKVDIPTVLIVMGSQGSETINAHLKLFVPLLANESFQVILVTGTKHYQDFVAGLVIPNNCIILEHVDQLRVLSYIDLIVARAGATTISEVIASKVPAIFVPSPYVANNHQLKNVEALLEVDAALLLEEKDFTSDSLIHVIHKILDNETRRKQLSHHLESLATPHATEKMIEMIETT